MRKSDITLLIVITLVACDVWKHLKVENEEYTETIRGYSAEYTFGAVSVSAGTFSSPSDEGTSYHCDIMIVNSSACPLVLNPLITTGTEHKNLDTVSDYAVSIRGGDKGVVTPDSRNVTIEIPKDSSCAIYFSHIFGHPITRTEKAYLRVSGFASECVTDIEETIELRLSH